MLFRQFGATEIIIIVVVIVLLFGVGMLPKIGKNLGKALSEFKTAVRKKSSSNDENGEKKSKKKKDRSKLAPKVSKSDEDNKETVVSDNDSQVAEKTETISEKSE